MKFKLFFIVLILPFLMLFACKKDNDSYIQLKEVKLNSFGFYADDNPGVLFEDYVITDIEMNDILLLLPEDVNKSNLVARFTVNDKDIVKVDGILQLSGQTVNDFNIPVDYILSDGNNNARYTITIGKAPENIWKKVPVKFEDFANTIVMKVNPETSVPFVMYNEYRSPSSSAKANMVILQNDAWVTLGPISDGQITSDINFTFNSKGVPYVSYADYTASVSRTHTVKKFVQGKQWEVVGEKGITSGRATFNSLSFVDDNNLMLFSTFDATGGALARRELDISIFNGHTWTTNLTMPGRPSNQVSYLLTSKKHGNTIYLGVFNAINPNSFSIYKFANNTWETLLDSWKDPNGTAMTIRDFDIEIDHSGNVYVAFADNSQDGVLKHRVIKYDANLEVVSNVGSYLPGASGGLYNFDLDINPFGTPYLVYDNENGYPSVVSIDKETKDWTIPFVFEMENVDDLHIDFLPNGEAYIVYLKSRELIVHRYSKP